MLWYTIIRKRERKITTILSLKKTAHFYMIDDDTTMPIACTDYNKAVEIVNTKLDGDLERIYEVTKKVTVKK